MEDDAKRLLMSIEARLEKSDHEIGQAAVEWLQVEGSAAAPSELREAFRVRALGELWRRERLRGLFFEVRAGSYPVEDRAVYFLALDACDPKTIPSFREWLAERTRRG